MSKNSDIKNKVRKTHDFSLVFDTANELWQRVLDIFACSESYPKKKTKGRELHHKFPRSFSKKLGEEVDNSEDNLISLTPADHFRVHYYYYLLANKGYRQPMALAFQLMLRAPSKQISPATMEEMAFDYEELRREAIVARTDAINKWRDNNSDKELLRLEHIKESQNRPEVALKKSKSMKGKNKGESNGMYGKEPWSKTHSITAQMTDDEIIRWKDAISKSNKGRVKSEEECLHISESKKGNKNPMFRKFQWNDNTGHHVIDMPDYIPDEELQGYRMALHYIWDNAPEDERHKKDWRMMVNGLIEQLELMDKYNK